MAVELSPITDADIERVATFMNGEMDDRIPAEEWERLMRVPWRFECPNHGFMLLDDDSVVGAYIALYSDRTSTGGGRVCNLGPWCVTREHRSHGMRLPLALLEQEGYVFTDLTPSSTVIPLNLRLGFQRLGERAAVVPTLPWPLLPARGSVSSDPEVVERSLRGEELQIFRDHADSAAVRQVVLASGDERCLIVLRKERRRGIKLAFLLYVSDHDLYRRLAGRLGRHLLLRHGVVAHVAEPAIVADPPRPSVGVHAPFRMLRPHGTPPAAIDYLYSELTRLHR